MPRYYIAYGSNLNFYQMSRRCPAAEALVRITLHDWKLVFRGVADCIVEEGSICYGGLWSITPACERELDRYEGVRGGLYRKEEIPITVDGVEATALIYTMNSDGIHPPSASYLRGITEGYEDFKMPKKAFANLRSAVQHSWDQNAPSHLERRRYRRTGRPRLAPRPGRLPAMPATGVEITLAPEE